MQTPEGDFLEQRPEAKTLRIEDLMREMQRGRVRIPAFQRPFQWKRDDARKLIDSLYRGYPISSLLMWERRAEAGELRLSSGLAFKADARDDAWWVVDGQQRLVSLARVLLTPNGVADDFALDFDLDEQRVMPARDAAQRDADPARWLPLNQVVDSEQLVAWLVARQPGPARQAVAIRVGKRLREYDVPVYIVRTERDAVLREIFGRINNSGKPLNVHQVFEALNSGRSMTRPDSLSTMADALAGLRFGRLDEALIYRALRVVQGQDVVESGREQPQRLADEVAEQAFAHTHRALAASVQFLARDAGIAHWRVLPYKQPLVTLAKFFHFHPQPVPRSRELLARWLWRGALNGSHQGNTVSTREALALIEPEDEEGSVQRLLHRVGRTAPTLPGPEQRFRFRDAAAKLQTLALLHLRPRDLGTGAPIDAAAWLDPMEGGDDEMLPPQILASGVDSPLRFGIANRMVQAPGGVLRSRLLAVSDPSIMDSHGITLDAWQALQRGDGAEFLRLRARLLGELSDAFFRSKARWDESDRPSLRALQLNDEG